jgi:peptide chain release factor subunit 1
MLPLEILKVIHKFGVDLPKKHGRGGQSALRFARLRLEKRHNYVRKVTTAIGKVNG